MRVRTLLDPPLPPLEFLVPGLIQKAALTVIAGPAGSGKSAITVNLAVASATRSEWLGEPVDGGPVLWAAAEAAVSTEHRFRALADRGAPISIADRVPNLLDDGAFDAFCDGIDEASERLGVAVRVVVLDALASAMRGGDENSSRDMTRAMGVLLRLAEERELSLITIAHTGKGGSLHVRGHSSVIADATSVFSIAGEEDEKSLVCLKQRDAEMSKSIPFRLIAEGGALRATRVESAPGKPKERTKRIPPDALTMLGALKEIGGQTDWNALRDRCSIAFDGRSDGAKRQAISNAKRHLLESGAIVLDGDRVSVSSLSANVSKRVPADVRECQQKCQQQHPL